MNHGDSEVRGQTMGTDLLPALLGAAAAVGLPAAPVEEDDGVDILGVCVGWLLWW